MLHGILSLFDTFWYHLEKSEHSGVLLITIWHVGNFNKHGMNQQSTLLLLSDEVPTSFTGRPLAGTLCRDRMPRPSLRHLFTFHRRFNPFLNWSFCSLKGPNVKSWSQHLSQSIIEAKLPDYQITTCWIQFFNYCIWSWHATDHSCFLLRIQHLIFWGTTNKKLFSFVQIYRQREVGLASVVYKSLGTKLFLVEVRKFCERNHLKRWAVVLAESSVIWNNDFILTSSSGF